MTRRAHISDRTKLAAMVCELLAIPHEHQVLMHEDQALALVDWDHYPVPKALGGSDHFSNLRALLRSTHRAITAKRDVPTIAKVKRVAKKEAQHRAALRGAFDEVIAFRKRQPHGIRSRPFPKDNRPKGQRMRRARP